jgi:transglutaminase-like putative cysteine protease
VTGRARLSLQAAVATIAASSALGSVFHGTGWVLPVAGAVLLVAAVNELLRRSRVVAALGPVVAAGAVLCYLTAGYASATAYAHVVPSSASLQTLGDIARSGFTDVRTMATPVPTHRGLVLLAIVGVAAVELVVDLLAVTLRRAAIAGVPLLAMFVLCTSIAKGGVSFIAFVLGTVGFLWLLLIDSRERIGRWGRTFGGERTRGQVSWSEGDLTPSPLAALGRRIGATAIAVGVALPMLVPGLHGGLPKHGGGGLGTGKGSNHVVTLNPIVNIRAQLLSTKPIPLMVVRSSDPAPGYLRLTALDNFDGTTFYPVTLNAPSSAKVSKGINAPDVSGTPVATSVHVDELSMHWLPVPAQVESVKGADDWLYDTVTNTIFSARSNTQNLTYSASSVRVDPNPLDLEQAPPVDPSQFTRDLALPQGIDIGVRTLAASITAAAPSPFAKAVAIQNYLDHSPYVYDATVRADDSARALTDFLLVSKRGFCQQYAAAMAVLARIEHIPARVAVGFTRGERQSDGTWLVTSHDAHAWPELYFTGFGWLPFEPTPRNDGQTVRPAFTHVSTSTQRPVGDTTRPGGTAPQQNDALGGPARKLANSDHQAGSLKTIPAPQTRHASTPWPWLVALAVLVVALAAPATARQLARRRRLRSQRPDELWDELRATAVDAGVDWVDGLTPRGAGRVVLGAVPLPTAAQQALDRVVRAEERVRYAALSTAVDADTVRADLELVAASMWAQCSPAARVAARVWPRSTMHALRDVGVRIADALDAIDAVVARLGRWVRRSTGAVLSQPRPRSS